MGTTKKLISQIDNTAKTAREAYATLFANFQIETVQMAETRINAANEELQKITNEWNAAGEDKDATQTQMDVVIEQIFAINRQIKQLEVTIAQTLTEHEDKLAQTMGNLVK